MKKNFLFFLVVGLTFTALQFATVAAQTGMPGGQCDPNPACDPTSGTCCGQCDPNPACVMDDPNAIPCCGAAGDPNASDMPPMGMTGGQCDPNPACVENCCPAGDPAPDTAPAEDSLLAIEPAG